MAKKVEFIPEVLESILVKVTEKFSDKTFMGQIVSTIVIRVAVIHSKVYDVKANLTAFSNRIDEVERKLQSTSPSPKGLSDQMRKTPMELEAEKTERAKRAFNLIITALHPQQDVHDADIFEEFCENHLTVKPHPIRSSYRRQ